MNMIHSILAILPAPASSFSAEWDSVYAVISWVTGIAFIVVEGLLVYFIVKYRRKEGEKNKKTPFLTHSSKLEFFWTAIPTIIVLFIFYIGVKVYVDMRTIPEDAYQLEVIGQKWQWTVVYPNGVKKSTGHNCEVPEYKTLKDCEAAGKKWSWGDEIVIPTNKAVAVKLSSKDVIHSFYIPEFRVKQDAVPGSINYLWFNAIKPGEYRLFCTEYCGSLHSQMLGVVKAVPLGEFDSWLAAEAKAQSGEGQKEMSVEELQAAGQQLFLKKGCNACHSVKKGERIVGPSLAGIYGITEKLNGGKTAVVDDNYIMESLRDPNAKVVAGYPPAMPVQDVSDSEVKALIEYIKSLK